MGKKGKDKGRGRNLDEYEYSWTCKYIEGGVVCGATNYDIKGSLDRECICQVCGSDRASVRTANSRRPMGLLGRLQARGAQGGALPGRRPAAAAAASGTYIGNTSPVTMSGDRGTGRQAWEQTGRALHPEGGDRGTDRPRGSHAGGDEEAIRATEAKNAVLSSRPPDRGKTHVGG